jgi:O-antigen/teichoic acid export membrane protein
MQHSASPSPQPDPKRKKPSDEQSLLRRLTIRGSIWVLIGFGLGQLMRFAGNLVMTRLLFPEAFGMMGIVNAVLGGLNMFSDVGLKPSIVQNKRGEDPLFLRTVWTLQIFRGIGLAILAAILAYPIAVWNESPNLFIVIAVTGLTSVVTGLNSSCLFLYSRRLLVGMPTVVGLFANFISIITMVVWAHWIDASVWALVVGAFMGSFVTLIASHTILAEIHMYPQWDKSAIKELINFGRWIFISTALGYLAAYMNVFIVGNYAGLSVLGVFIVARGLSRLAVEAITQLSNIILFPVYSRLVERDVEQLRTRTFKIRAVLLAVFLPIMWLMSLWGNVIIEFLYDKRYHDAGWMLQISAAGAIATTIVTTIRPVLLAKGDSFRSMLNGLARVIIQAIGMIVGYEIAGIHGMLVGFAAADWLSYPLLVYHIYDYGVWLPWLDAAAFCSSIVVIAIALWINL